MNKILLKKAIDNGSIYRFDNEEEPKYSFKGRIKILSFNEFKLSEKEINKNAAFQCIGKKIGCLVVEYTNLNFEEKKFITDKFVLYNEECEMFCEIEKQEIMQCIASCLERNIWGVLDDRNKTFIPKIKTKIEIFYLLPDKMNNYYLEIKNCKIEEI